MKTSIRKTLLAGACGAALMLVPGCGKPESSGNSQTSSGSAGPAPNPVESLAQKAGQSAAEVKQAADQTVAKGKTAAEQLAADAKQSVSAVATDVARQAESVIANVRQLIADKKYQEALTALQNAAKLQLTPEQKKTVEDLKAQAQKLASSDAVKAVGGLLQPPPPPK